MSLLNTLTGGKSGDASDDLDKALAAIQSVQTPTIQEMQFQLQKLVSAGVLTPEKAQFYLANPSAYQSEVVPQLGTQTQENVIGQLMGDAGKGGVSDTEEAATQDVIRKLNTQEKGQRDAILQNAAARGTLTGGETMAAQLEANQGDAANANQLALGNRATAEELALQELTTAGTMGAGLQGQENTQANTVAGAVDAINKFNAAQEQGTENFNVQNENASRAANLENAQRISDTNVGNENVHELQQSQLPQEVYQDALEKAQSEAGVYGEKAGQDTGQGKQLLSIEGGIADAVSPAIGKAFDKVTAPNTAASTDASGPSTAAVMTGSDGGLVEYLARGGGVVPTDGKPTVPGNSPKNDRIPAVLSPGEVVLPRSVAKPAMQGQPDKVMEFLNRMRGPKSTTPAHPHDVKSVLDALELRRASNA